MIDLSPIQSVFHPDILHGESEAGPASYRRNEDKRDSFF